MKQARLVPRGPDAAGRSSLLRSSAGDDETGMKIYFCDGCNESVPLADVQSGQVTTIKGKLFCRNCIPPGTLSAPVAAPPRAARGSGAPLLALVVLLLLGWTAWRDRALLFGEAPVAEVVPAEPSVTSIEQSLAGLQAALSQVRADGDQQGRHLTTTQGDLEALRASDDERRRALEALATQVDALRAAQARAGELVERVQLLGTRLDALQRRVDALSDVVGAHQAALEFGVTPAAGLADEGGAPLALGEGLMPIADPQRAAEIEELRRQLLSREADLRFEGVDRVEQGGYSELLPELVKLLSDEDLFVRLHAMNVLGNFGHEPAVPALLDLLQDASPPIRKTAAETLVRLTGYDPGYDAKASSAERARVATAWRQWWEGR